MSKASYVSSTRKIHLTPLDTVTRSLTNLTSIGSSISIERLHCHFWKPANQLGLHLNYVISLGIGTEVRCVQCLSAPIVNGWMILRKGSHYEGVRHLPLHRYVLTVVIQFGKQIQAQRIPGERLSRIYYLHANSLADQDGPSII